MTTPETPIQPPTPASTAPALAGVSRPGVSGWWRAGFYFLAIVLGLGVASAMSMYAQFEAQLEHMQTQLKAVPHIKFIAVMQDTQQAPAMLVTLDPAEFTAVVQRLNKVVEGPQDSMQLWALKDGARPRSLGVLDSKTVVQRINAAESDLTGVQTLAISVEAKGGVSPAQGPSLPYLFQGPVVLKSN